MWTLAAAAVESHAEGSSGASLAVGLGTFALLVLLLVITMQFDRNR